MKERIIKALRRYTRDTPKIDDMGRMIMEHTGLTTELFLQRSRILLSAILHEYDRFSVGTIDRFNSRILRTFALDLDLPMNYEVEMETSQLIEEASDRLLNALGEDADVRQLLVRFSAQQVADEKDWRIHRELCEKGKLLFQEQHRSHLEKLAGIAPAEFLQSIRRVQSRREALGEKAQKRVREMLELVERGSAGPVAFRGQYLPGWLRKQAKLRYANELSMLKEEEGEVLCRVGWMRAAVEDDHWISRTAPPADLDWIEANAPALQAGLLELLNLFREDVRLGLYSRNLYGVAVLSLLDQSLRKVKREREVVHISEFNWTIAAQVRQQPALYIYERLGEKYGHYFIDEFQDTSVMQWQNLLPLAHEALSRGGSCMVVGDGKQAIYRWRGGEMGPFLGLAAGSKPRYQSGTGMVEVPFEPQPKRLQDNWRSRKKIVEFNNGLYTLIANQLRDPAHIKLYSSAVQNAKGQEGGYVTIHCYNKGLEKEDLEAEMFGWTQRRIDEVLASGAEPRDICILVRSKKEGQLIARFLQGEGLPVISNELLVLSASPEVNVLVQFLRWKATGNHRDAVSRILLYLLGRMDIALQEHHDLMHRALKENEFEQILKQRLLPDWDAVRWDRLTLYEKMNTLCGWIPGFPSDNAYVEFFLDLCHQFSVRAQGTEVEFLEWWNDACKKHSVVVPNGLNAVQVMTIHKSKGLEFPVVLLPQADWAYKTELAQDWFVLPDDEREEIALPEVLLSLKKDMKFASEELARVYLQNEEALRLDELNAFYVATTRPGDELHIAFRPTAIRTGVQDYLKTWVEQNDKTLEPGGTISIGEPVREWPQEQSDTGQISNETVGCEEWWGKLRLSFESERYWGRAGDARPYGMEVHRILQEIDSRDDVERVLQDWESDGMLGPSAREGLRQKIRHMLAQPEMARYFDPADTARNEASIIVPRGSTQRPDRLVFHRDGGVSVVDFKTGAPGAKHRRQVDAYVDLLNLANVNVVNKALIYLDPFQLDENWESA